MQSSQNPVNRYGQPVAQHTHLLDKSPCMNHLQNAAPQAEQLSTSRTDPSVIELLFNQQQVLQRDKKLLFLSFLIADSIQELPFLS